jgi:hypothetical protein
LLARSLAERCRLSFAVQAPRQTPGFHPAQRLAAQRGVLQIVIKANQEFVAPRWIENQVLWSEERIHLLKRSA